ncbi:hypothetical protein EVAR_64443_1 [Eumeta japonica]|uniref:Uncharacterized protein n=1 Tax=Eumeta variegata TaxID=151549 RepID=A0A4C1YRR2_EUMVA|nr:hypothetical protein EVAR_64443_1 [Eumeta japonica]
MRKERKNPLSAVRTPECTGYLISRHLGIGNHVKFSVRTETSRRHTGLRGERTGLMTLKVLMNVGGLLLVYSHLIYFYEFFDLNECSIICEKRELDACRRSRDVVYVRGIQQWRERGALKYPNSNRGAAGTYQEQTEKIIVLPGLAILTPPKAYALRLGTGNIALYAALLL